MKYGMRERISGAIIVIALAVIFLPMLFDDPAPRDERPEPVLSVEEPVEVERVEVEEPKPPVRLGSLADPMPQAPADDEDVEEERGEASGGESSEPAVAADDDAANRETDEADGADPIAELARRAEAKREQQPPQRDEPEDSSDEAAPTAASASGEWAVQAGSFGEPGNAERLETQLKEQGFQAYRRERDNNLTTVYVGPYESSEAGERARSELKSRANIQGLLVRVKP